MFNKPFSMRQLNGTDVALLVAQNEVRRRLQWAIISIVVMLIVGSVNVAEGYEWFKVGLNVCIGFVAINLIIFLKREISSYISISHCAIEYYKQIAEDALIDSQGEK